MNTRRVARELALLTLSQLETLPADARPSLPELVGRAAAMLSGEAREHIKTACATLTRSRDTLEKLTDNDFGPDLVTNVIRNAGKRKADGTFDEQGVEKSALLFWRRAKEQDALIELREGLVESEIQEVANAIDALEDAADLLGSALEWPTIAALADADLVRDFAVRQIDTYLKHRKDIDKDLNQAAEHWSIERMASLDRDVLRLALAELKHSPDIPVEVAINEAVELAKKYGTDESGRFVNGVLSAFADEAAKLRK